MQSAMFLVAAFSISAASSMVLNLLGTSPIGQTSTHFPHRMHPRLGFALLLSVFLKWE